MKADGLATRALTIGFCLLFFTFLFGPLAIMVITAFNSASFPRITPWECFTTDWFKALLGDRRLLGGLGNTLIIGVGVVVVATPIGLAGALALSDMSARLRSLFYTVFITPILVPGVVIGISTIVFWDKVGGLVGAGYGSPFYDGLVLTVLGQVTFISAYAMLIFLARLQRFDHSQTEAALDLGATPGQAFRLILLPFLRPAIGSAAVLAFLASAENYNTTVFTIVSESTFTTVLASKVRYGIDPSISAVAVIIIALTLIGAVVHEAHVRRRAVMVGGGSRAAALLANPAARVLGHPATLTVLLVALAGLAGWGAYHHESDACQTRVLEEKREIQQRLMEEQRRAMQDGAPAQPAAPAETGGRSATPFGGVFAPGNLGPSAPAGTSDPPARPASPFGGAFDPKALAPKNGP